MGSRDRPHKEVKKKPKDAGKAKIQPLLEPPQQVDVVRKARKPRTADEETTDQG